MQATDKYPLASPPELKTFCSLPAAPQPGYLKASSSPQGHDHKATPTAK